MLQKWKAIGIIAFLTAVLILGISPVSDGSPTRAVPTGTLAHILTTGEMEVGMDIAYAPFESYDLDDPNKVIGFDADIMNAIAYYISVEYETEIDVVFEHHAWTPIIPDLKADQMDVICSAMTITRDRELEVDFTRWYYQSAMGLLVTEANPKNIQDTDDLNVTGVRIGVQTGTTTHIWLQTYNIDDVATVLPYDDFPLAIEALVTTGSVDVVMGDVAVLNYEAEVKGGAKMVYSFFGDQIENFGIATREGDNDLRDAINRALDILLGTNVNEPAPSDLYNAMFYTWHGASHPAYTGTVTSMPIPTWSAPPSSTPSDTAATDTTSEESSEEDSPAFGAIVALGVLIGSGLALRRRRKP